MEIPAQFTEIFRVAITGISVASRLVFDGGVAAYSGLEFTKFAGFNGTTLGNVLIGTVVFGTVSSILLTKSIPTYYSQTRVSATISDEPLGWGGFLVDIALRGCGCTYGLLNTVSTYFFNTVLMRSVFSLMGSENNTAIWKEVLTQISSVLMAIASYYNYYTNDYRYIRNNTLAIARGIDAKSFPMNRAMALTALIASLNLITYPFQAYFLAGPSIRGIPYLGTLLKPVGVEVLSGAASGVVFSTVLIWMRSVYEQIATPTPEPRTLTLDPSQSEQALSLDEQGSDAESDILSDVEDPEIELTPTPENGEFKSSWPMIAFCAAAYITGTIDSLGSNGISIFISVIETLQQLLDVNPYGGIMALAIFCGINAFIVQMFFSTLNGTKQTVKLLNEAYHSTHTSTPAPAPTLSPTLSSPTRGESSSTECLLSASEYTLFSPSGSPLRTTPSPNRFRTPSPSSSPSSSPPSSPPCSPSHNLGSDPSLERCAM